MLLMNLSIRGLSPGGSGREKARNAWGCRGLETLAKEGVNLVPWESPDSERFPEEKARNTCWMVPCKRDAKLCGIGK
jgi:hypothetical protein